MEQTIRGLLSGLTRKTFIEKLTSEVSQEEQRGWARQAEVNGEREVQMQGTAQAGTEVWDEFVEEDRHLL